jgi:hypothetical protein
VDRWLDAFRGKVLKESKAKEKPAAIPIAYRLTNSSKIAPGCHEESIRIDL